MENLPEGLLFEVDGAVGIITLNRPDSRNAITTDMYEGIEKCLEEVKRRDEIKALIITGNGQAFSAGSDAETRLLSRIVNDHYAPLEKTRSELLESLMLRLASRFYSLGKPSIAAINGVTSGAGLSIALLCDIRIASDKARFGAAWVNVGLIPDIGATFTLPRLIGIDRALKLFITGELIDAKEAERICLVTQVVPHDELMKVTRDLTAKIVKGPSVAIELTRRALYCRLAADLQSQLYFENYAQDICFMSEDFREGVRAFREKRRPTFKGS